MRTRKLFGLGVAIMIILALATVNFERFHRGIMAAQITSHSQQQNHCLKDLVAAVSKEITDDFFKNQPYLGENHNNIVMHKALKASILIAGNDEQIRNRASHLGLRKFYKETLNSNLSCK
jgi:hypothetical protein